MIATVNRPSPLLAGVDEAGRGPLAGPVVAAAVVLDPDSPIAGLEDSKKISEKRRNSLEKIIKSNSLSWSVAAATVSEIDELNILWASMLAMQRAVAGLAVQPDYVQVDGNRCPDLTEPCEAIVGGDRLVCAISAASILAKVERDRQMTLLHAQFPQYAFNRHKGYPTVAHRDALIEHGVTVHHRRTFGPVARVIAEQSAKSI
ncbi:MAG: ribonuclease HII [Pseudomonadota bacterium]